MNKIFKWSLAVILGIIVLAAGFTFVVKEGTCAIVSRFGKTNAVYNDAGLHFKLPVPIDKILVYDTRNQYMDSGYTETLTNDKINIVLQTYLIWNIEDPQKFYASVGDFRTAQNHLNDLVANTKNGVMGNYKLSALVSTNLEDIKIDEICKEIESQVATTALKNYGIQVSSLKIKRLALPSSNITSVFEQMIADRQKYVTQLISEGDRDAAIIVSEANAQAAKIIADGKLEASQIDAQTEKMVAEIYGEAYDKNSDLFIFLKKLIALENSVNPNTVIIMRADDSPFDVMDEVTK